MSLFRENVMRDHYTNFSSSFCSVQGLTVNTEGTDPSNGRLLFSTFVEISAVC